MFAERGYTAVEVDIEAGAIGGTAVERMKGMVSGMPRRTFSVRGHSTGQV